MSNLANIRNNMESAPKGGSNILILTEITHYVRNRWECVGYRWIECWWDSEKKEWQEWCGSYVTTSTKDIRPRAWTYLPKPAELPAFNVTVVPYVE